MKSHGWSECAFPAPENARSNSERIALEQLRSSGTKLWDKGQCRVLVSQERYPGKGERLFWHLSISCADRYPTWDEIKDARYSLLPFGLTFAQLLPPMNEFVNIHPNCFHLWEFDT